MDLANSIYFDRTPFATTYPYIASSKGFRMKGQANHHGGSSTMMRNQANLLDVVQQAWTLRSPKASNKGVKQQSKRWLLLGMMFFY